MKLAPPKSPWLSSTMVELENYETPSTQLSWATTTIKTPSGTSLPCAIETGGEISLITRKTLNTRFPDAKIDAYYLADIYAIPSRYLKASQLVSTEVYKLDIEFQSESGKMVTDSPVFRVCEWDELLEGVVVLAGRSLWTTDARWYVDEKVNRAGLLVK